MSRLGGSFGGMDPLPRVSVRSQSRISMIKPPGLLRGPLLIGRHKNISSEPVLWD